MNWPTPIHQALNDADSILSLLYYRGFGDSMGQASKTDIGDALTVVRAAEQAVKGGAVLVLTRDRLREALFSAFAQAMNPLGGNGYEVADRILARLTGETA